MFRFVLGLSTGFSVAGICLVSLHMIAGGMPPQPTHLAKTDVPTAQPTRTDTLDPAEVQAARASLEANRTLRQEVTPDAPLPEVSDNEAVRSARFAGAMRAATGAVPQPQDRTGTLILSAAPNTRTQVTSAYFTTWDDLLKRCYAVVAEQQPMTTDGLTSHGDDRVNYTQADTRQTWFSDDKAFKVQVKMESGYGASSGVVRMCLVETNRFALVEEDAVLQLKPRFHGWWDKERFAAITEPVTSSYGTLKTQEKYHGKTQFGSAQGCKMYVSVNQVTLGDETETKFHLWETSEDGCGAAPATGTGGVRVNRLPQVGD